jgi:hypothetical protein
MSILVCFSFFLCGRECRQEPEKCAMLIRKKSEVGVVGYHKSLTRTGPWVRFPYLVLFFFFLFLDNFDVRLEGLLFVSTCFMFLSL